MGGLAQARSLLASTGSDSVLVALSGGKDSLVVLDLCKRVFRHVEAFMMYTVPGLACEDGPVDAAARRHGITVHKTMHWAASDWLKNATFRPHVHALETWRQTKLTHIEEWARARTGIEWIAYGHRADESLERRGMLTSFKGCNRKEQRVYPIWQWVARDVYAYMRAKKIPLPPAFGVGAHGVSGVDLRLETLEYLRDHYPDDLAKILEVFPWAAAQFKRKEMYG